MSVQVTSLISDDQTIDSVVLHAYAKQERPSSTTALVAAQTARTIQLDEVESGRGYIQKETPLTGATVAVANKTTSLIVVPAATIAALTVNLPASPGDGQEVEMSFDQIVTTLTMAAAGSDTLKGALAAATAKGFGKWRYSKADTTWYRVG